MPESSAKAKQVRKRDASPAPKTQQQPDVQKAKQEDKVSKGTLAAKSARHEWLAMLGWIFLLVSTQLVMIIYTKRCTTQAPLPLLLCLAQFAVSAILSAAAIFVLRKGQLFAPKEVLPDVLPLSTVWTGGFILFNAAALHMSPGMVNVIRCMEPLATVLVGFALGQRFSWQVLATLLPICGGVAMASSSGGIISSLGVFFAMLSNLAFCCRTFCLQRLQRNKQNQLDDLAIFFNVSWISAFLLPALEILVEASEVPPAMTALISSGRLGSFVFDMLASSIAFFFYQFIQLLVMSKLSPLAFSVLTPIVKACMIVTLTICYGDRISVISAGGIALSVGGGYLFTRAKSVQKKPEDAVKKTS